MRPGPQWDILIRTQNASEIFTTVVVMVTLRKKGCQGGSEGMGAHGLTIRKLEALIGIAMTQRVYFKHILNHRRTRQLYIYRIIQLIFLKKSVLLPEHITQ
jgi:hypothetical protein